MTINIRKRHVVLVGAILLFFGLGTALAYPYPVFSSFVGGLVILAGGCGLIIIGSLNAGRPYIAVDQLLVGIVVMVIGIVVSFTFSALLGELKQMAVQEHFVPLLLAVSGFAVMVFGLLIIFSTPMLTRK